MQPIIIIDDFFKEKNALEGFKNKINTFAPTRGVWLSHPNETYTDDILTTAGNYYDMNKCVGFEVWTHNNSKPTADYDGGWHYDKDEYRYGLNNILSFPICSCIFYVEVQNLEGGRLVIEDIKIIPRPNRLIIFGPGKKHYVEDFSGVRYSININPWNRKLEEYDAKRY